MNKEIFGLLGYPIKYSFSPAMHNAAFQALGIEAEYILFEKRPEELADFFKELQSGSISGVNVTIPYKEKVIKYLDELDEGARLIGAVNTISSKNNRLTGYNTDGLGFVASLKEEGIDPKGKRVVIIGAGGASRAVSLQLAKEEVKSIAFLDIIFDRAENLAFHITENIPQIEIFAIRKEELEEKVKKADILINATPVGMKPGDPLPIDSKLLHPHLLVYDLIYNPPKTKLLAEAEKMGAKILNGLGMLLHQGALSFKIWTNREAPLDIMKKALEEKLSRTR